ncbi:MAG: PAS domain S-box protein, partial [Nitrospina sp.]|nr:PAS domain S-box protein [Nitrospina sp.]
MAHKPSYEELEQRVQGLEIITNELRQAEKALLESEKKFRFLTENIADIVWTLDQNFETTYVSPSIENMLGFTPEERKQQSLEEMITPDSLQKIQMKFLEELERDENNSFDSERFITMEVQYYRKDSSIVWMENSIKAIRDPAGKIVGMHGVSRD